MVEMGIEQKLGSELEFEFKEQESEFQTVILKQKYGFDSFFEGIPLKTIENSRKVTYHLYRTHDPGYVLLWEAQDSYFGDIERDYRFFDDAESLIRFAERPPDEPHDRLLLLQLIKTLGLQPLIPL